MTRSADGQPPNFGGQGPAGNGGKRDPGGSDDQPRGPRKSSKKANRSMGKSAQNPELSDTAVYNQEVIQYAKEHQLCLDTPAMPVIQTPLFFQDLNNKWRSVDHLVLSDTGSSCSFVDQDLASQLGLQKKGTFRGSVETMAGVTDMEADFFLVQYATVSGFKTRSLVLATEHLGYHSTPPSRDLAHIDKILNLNGTAKINGGPIKGLWGQDNKNLLTFETQPQPSTNLPYYSAIRIEESTASKERIIVGTLGPTCTNFTQVQTNTIKVKAGCFMFHSEYSKTWDIMSKYCRYKIPYPTNIGSTFAGILHTLSLLQFRKAQNSATKPSGALLHKMKFPRKEEK